MEKKYSAFEILQTAEKIERNSVTFYQKAATLFDDPKLRSKLFELAQWEGRHEELFTKMRKELVEQLDILGTFNFDEYSFSNPKLLDGLAHMTVDPDAAYELTGKESKKDILDRALTLEKDTIVFYRGMRRAAADKTAKETINEIIEEEKRHVRIVRQSLAQL